MKEHTDSVAAFSLRNATGDELGTALALCHHDFLLWHAQLLTVAQFPFQAQSAGVHRVLAAEKLDALYSGATAGWLDLDELKMTTTPEELAIQMAGKQFEMIEHSARITAVVMLHSACERFLWRLVRLGIVASRARAVERIGQRQVLVRELTRSDKEDLIDECLEEWWWKLERETILKKWDALVHLVGSPGRLRSGEWYFDREMLEEFDDVRHDCVHHKGRRLSTFALDEFSLQLWRAQMVWLVTLARALNVKIPAQIAFAGIPGEEG